jgi:hypothetical protein
MQVMTVLRSEASCFNIPQIFHFKPRRLLNCHPSESWDPAAFDSLPSPTSNRTLSNHPNKGTVAGKIGSTANAAPCQASA